MNLQRRESSEINKKNEATKRIQTNQVELDPGVLNDSERKQKLQLLKILNQNALNEPKKEKSLNDISLPSIQTRMQRNLNTINNTVHPQYYDQFNKERFNKMKTITSTRRENDDLQFVLNEDSDYVIPTPTPLQRAPILHSLEPRKLRSVSSQLEVKNYVTVIDKPKRRKMRNSKIAGIRTPLLKKSNRNESGKSKLAKNSSSKEPLTPSPPPKLEKKPTIKCDTDFIDKNK